MISIIFHPEIGSWITMRLIVRLRLTDIIAVLSRNHKGMIGDNAL